MYIVYYIKYSKKKNLSLISSELWTEGKMVLPFATPSWWYQVREIFIVCGVANCFN